VVVISDVLDLSKEVLDRRVNGWVELYKILGEQDAFEKNSRAIFKATYPTRPLKEIIKFISRKMDPSKEVDSRGAFVISGIYGTGKSHIQLTLYHLFSDPKNGKKWLEEHGLEDIHLPSYPETILMTMLNLKRSDGTKYEYLWEPIYEKMGREDLLEKIGDFPTVDDIVELVGKGTVVLLIDEIEKWYGSIDVENEPHRAQRNLAFLQNLMDASNQKDVRLFTFITLLLENDDIATIVGRTQPIKFDLTSGQKADEDRINIILYRLIDKFKDKNAIKKIASQYIGVYKRSDDINISKYKELEEKIISTYPFHPEVLEVLIDRFHAAKESQNTRGLLYILAEVLYAKSDNVDLILMSDIDAEANKDDLTFIDPKLVENCLNDVKRLKKQKYAKEILETVLIYSLTKMARSGATKTHILLGVLRVGISSNDVMLNFTGHIYGRAWYLHKLNGEYAIQEDINTYAIIDSSADTISKKNAILRMEQLVKERIFTGPDVYIFDSEGEEEKIPDNKNLKIAISFEGNDISFERFKPLFEGRTYQNTIIVVVPKKGTTVKSTGLIEMARRVVAGEGILAEPGEKPEDLHEIIKDYINSLVDRLREKFGRAIRFVGENTFPKNISPNKESAIKAHQPDIDNIKTSIVEILEREKDKGLRVDLLTDELYIKKNYPLITDPGIITTSLKELCKDKEIQLVSQNDVAYFGDRNVTIVDSMYAYHKDYVKIPEPPQEDILYAGPTTSEAVVSAEGGTSGEEVSKFKILTIPPMNPLLSTAKPELIDKLDREIKSTDKIKEFRLKIQGNLQKEELSNLNIPFDESLEEGSTITTAIVFRTNMTKNDIVSFLRDLKVPQRATFELQMEVLRGE